MRLYITLFTALLLTLAACSNKRPSLADNPVLHTGKLPARQYTIDINKDTLLHTAGGAWLKIDKGSFSSATGKAVLEIKEAFTLADMIKAGLATQSNGQPLMSGGMMYIGAAAGQDLQFKKPVRVAVPTDFLQPGMQLYKGQPGTDSSLNWTEPRPLTSSQQLTTLEKGAALFAKKCASCHGIGQQGAGPDLAHVLKRDLRRYETNDVYRHRFRKTFSIPIQFIQEQADTAKSDELYSYQHTNPYICNLIGLFDNKEVDLSADFERNPGDWALVYTFIQNESDRRSLDFPPHARLDSCIDSCNLYNRLKAVLDERRTQELLKKQDIEKRKQPMVKEENDFNTPSGNGPSIPILPPPEFDDKVKPQYYDSKYYQFTIESFGWVNVDAIAGGEGVLESELTVTLTGAYKERVQLYLINPSHKMLGQGGPTGKSEHEYAFFNRSGHIPLPQNVNAFILAVTEDEQGVAYSLTPFTTGIRQQFSISLKAAGTDDFNKAIETLGADRLKVSAAGTEKGRALRDAEKSIRQLEEELKKAETLKPKGCDCNCGAAPAPATASPVAKNSTVADYVSESRSVPSIMSTAHPDSGCRPCQR